MKHHMKKEIQSMLFKREIFALQKQAQKILFM